MSDDDKNIIFGGERTTDFTKLVGSLGELLLFQLNNNGDKVGIIDGLSGRKITYKEIKEKALHLAEFFRQNGVKAGDVIGICSENRIEFPFTVYGALLIGATVTTINLLYTEREMIHTLQLTRPKVIFGTELAIERLTDVAKNYPFVEKIIQYGDTAIVKGCMVFEDILKDQRYAKPEDEFVNPPENLDRSALIMMSSGTTGLPKGVQITERNILATLGQSVDARNKLYTEEIELIILSIIPWFHVYGLMTLISSSIGGIVLISLPRFEEHLFLSSIEKYKATHAFMVPPLMVFLAKHPLVAKYDLSSLKELYCGAAPLSKEVEDAVMARIPNLTAIRQGFGLSETTLSVLSTSGESLKPGSVGTVVIGTYCKVIDPETGKILGANEPGELCFKGPQIMKGYIGNTDATQGSIDKDGWLHTGDVGYYDDDKYFFIVDRLKELIKYKAFQVPPAELEALLVAHPQIADAAVIGLPDEAAGELPLAFVVKQGNSKITEKEIKDYIAGKVTNYKQLRGGVRFINEIPKNPSGKILRRELRLLIKKPQSKL
uniref:Luciferin 4-monooxygenase n=1 Tax=Nyssomyia neivai TaxID=330878 RepID=A0A1L8DYB2_9DIPT